MPITSLLVDFLGYDDYDHFVVSVRLIGNIMSSTNSEYVQNFYKNGLLESLVIGWQKYQHPEVDKECSWILGNIVASNNLLMTKAVISNPFFNQKFQEILQHVFNNQHLDSKSHASYVSGCREIMVLIKNVVRCYSLDISYLLITNLNLLPNLLPFIDPERLYF
jgi:hypothetical protein